MIKYTVLVITVIQFTLCHSYDDTPPTLDKGKLKSVPSAAGIKSDDQRAWKSTESDSNYHTHCLKTNCVPYHLCSENKTIITDGSGLLDSRFNPEEPCHYLEVCCEPDKKIDFSVPQYQSQGHSDEHVQKCGHKKGLGIQIKEYDNQAQYGEFPWMAAIMHKQNYYSKFEHDYICGGSIIHPHIVLTAAHCVYDKVVNNLFVRGGEWDTQTINEQYPHQDRHIKELVIHDKFKKDNLQYDIALLFLKDEFQLKGNVGTICLPPKGISFDEHICYASGWGHELFGKEGKYSVILKKRELPIVNHHECQYLLRKTRLGQHFLLHNTFLCAGGDKGKDMCKGDGGSPLVCPIKKSYDRYYQSGIVSWGIGCNDEKVPGVYVNIPVLREWIDKIVIKHGYDAKFYTYEL